MRRADASTVQRGPEFLLLVLLAAASVSLAQTQALQPDDQPSTIRGTVVNSVTDAPIARALVFTPSNHIAMLTDGEGHSEFTLPKVTNDYKSGHVLAIENGWDLDWSQPAVIAAYMKHGRTVQVGNPPGRHMNLTEAVEVQSK